jgi:hypothetical protein
MAAILAAGGGCFGASLGIGRRRTLGFIIVWPARWAWASEGIGQRDWVDSDTWWPAQAYGPRRSFGRRNGMGFGVIWPALEGWISTNDGRRVSDWASGSIGRR